MGDIAMSTGWDAYLAAPNAAELYAACRQNCRSAFERQKENIWRVFTATAPRAVACLGAGVLNDIPYRSFLAAGATVHLVDWMPGSVDAGLKLSIIERGEDGLPRCAYCTPAVDYPERYCRCFQHPAKPLAEGVCARFSPGQGEPLHCAAFERGELPAVHYDDVTAGYASDFGRAVSVDLGRVRSWKQAFARARTLAGRARRHHRTLSIPNDAVQLVTSSMVVSQFEHEPYGYFARQAAAQLGPPSDADEAQLRATMESFRTLLLDDQIERHCEEIDRILAPGGRCYLSTEIFHLLPDERRWIGVEGVPKALETLRRRFSFNFDIIPETELFARFEFRGGVSLVGAFVLESKK